MGYVFKKKDFSWFVKTQKKFYCFGLSIRVFNHVLLLSQKKMYSTMKFFILSSFNYIQSNISSVDIEIQECMIVILLFYRTYQKTCDVKF